MKQLARAYNDEVEWLLWLFYGMGQGFASWQRYWYSFNILCRCFVFFFS